jgi:hypothetical protein
MIVHVTEPAAISFPVRSWIVCENSHWTSLLLKVIEGKLSYSRFCCRCDVSECFVIDRDVFDCADDYDAFLF